MDTIESKTGEFLSKWGMTSDNIDMEGLLQRFRSEMDRGLGGDKKGSLKMIPTFVRVSDEVKREEPVIVIDAGGTNLRTCLVTFDAQGEIGSKISARLPCRGSKRR